jgi:hypothetical protein
MKAQSRPTPLHRKSSHEAALKAALHAYWVTIGRQGGSVSSPAKREAAKKNIKKRWAMARARQASS